MKISVITVTYNSERFIRDCIISVLNQDFQNIEHIIVDGASSDSTLEIVRDFAHINSVISEPDQGIYDAINKGISAATGDIIGILNSDDFFFNAGILSEVNHHFEKNVQIDAIYADVIFVDRMNPYKSIRYYSSKMFKPWMLRLGFQPAHPTFYVRKKIFQNYGVYKRNFRIAGDFELFVRLFIKYNIQSKYIRKPFVNMRIGGISSSGFANKLQLNREILHALSMNRIYSNVFLVYFKYLIKWWGFLIKYK